MANRHLVAAVAAAAAALIVAAAPASTDRVAAAAPTIRFGKIQYDSPGSPDRRSNRSINGEWVTVKNTGRARRSLTGWTIRDAYGHTYRFPRFSLGAGKSVRVHTGRGTNTAANLFWQQTNYVWNNTGDVAALRKPDGTRVDRCAWTSRGAGFTNC